MNSNASLGDCPAREQSPLEEAQARMDNAINTIEAIAMTTIERLERRLSIVLSPPPPQKEGVNSGKPQAVLRGGSESILRANRQAEDVSRIAGVLANRFDDILARLEV
jgi:hypothetical protein